MTMLGDEGDGIDKTQQSAGDRYVAPDLSSEGLSDICTRKPFLHVCVHQPSYEDFLAM